MKKRHPVWAVISGTYAIGFFFASFMPDMLVIGLIGTVLLVWLTIRLWQGPKIPGVASGTFQVDAGKPVHVYKSSVAQVSAPAPITSRQPPSFDDTEDYYQADPLAEAIPVKAPMIFIEYEDSGGEISERNITPRRITIKKNGDWRMQSFCHMREEQRTFLLSGIKRVIVDGKSVEPMPYFQELIETSDMYKIVKFKREHADELMVFSYIAKLDGKYEKIEREMVSAYFKQYYELDFEPEMVDTNEVLSSEFRQSLKAINRLDDEKRMMVKIALSALIKHSPDPMKEAAMSLIRE